MKSGRIVLASSVIIAAFTAMITMLLVASHGAGIESNGFHRFFLEKFGAKGILLSVSLAVSLVVTSIWLLGRYWPRGGSVLALALSIPLFLQWSVFGVSLLILRNKVCEL